jgi:hypothetical protein
MNNCKLRDICPYGLNQRGASKEEMAEVMSALEIDDVKFCPLLQGLLHQFGYLQNMQVNNIKGGDLNVHELANNLKNAHYNAGNCDHLGFRKFYQHGFRIVEALDSQNS